MNAKAAVEPLATTPNPATTVWVPMWNLAGGAANAYKGDWQGGQTYAPGDHVVYNGILYECVRQTTAAPVPWPPAAPSMTYGTSLPSSPVDGQEHVLVDSVTAPTYQWRLRYNAGRTVDAYKWEYIGGFPAEIVGSADYAAPTGWSAVPAPSFTVPRSGAYSMESYLDWTAGGGANIQLWTGPGDGSACYAGASNTFIASQQDGTPPSRAAANLAAGAAVRFWVYAGTTGATLKRRLLVVFPRAVS